MAFHSKNGENSTFYILLCSLWQTFSIVPAECIVGRRLGFYYELVATLLLPVLSFGVVMLMALQP